MPSHTFRRFLFPALRTMLGSFLFVLTFSFAAFSETELLLSPDEKLWLAQHPELRLGVIASRLPFEALSSERKQEGIASDYANWLEKTLGIRFVAHPVPDTGLHLPCGEGKLDVHLSAVDTPESRKTMLFTRPYLELPLVLFMMNDAPFVNGLQDMKGKRVAAVGERLLDILKDTSPEIRAVEARTTREALEMLERRQVDAVFEIPRHTAEQYPPGYRRRGDALPFAHTDRRPQGLAAACRHPRQGAGRHSPHGLAGFP